MTSRLAPSILLLLLASCAPRLLPGTEIRDTRDTRAITEVLGQYRQAMEKRDSKAVLALVAPDYFDTAGTSGLEDDVDRAELEKRLPADLEKVESVRLELTLRKLDVQGDRAEAEVFYEGWYRVKTPGGAVPRRDTDLQRMKLRKLNDAWKFVSGL